MMNDREHGGLADLWTSRLANRFDKPGSCHTCDACATDSPFFSKAKASLLAASSRTVPLWQPCSAWQYYARLSNCACLERERGNQALRPDCPAESTQMDSSGRVAHIRQGLSVGNEKSAIAKGKALDSWDVSCGARLLNCTGGWPCKIKFS